MLHQKPVRACTLLEAWTSTHTCNKFIHCFLNPITGSKKPSEVVVLKALAVWHVWMCYLFLWRVWEGKWRLQTASYQDTSIPQYVLRRISCQIPCADCYSEFYLCPLSLYLEDICGNEKLCAAILISSTLHLGAERKLCEKSREYPSLRNIKQVCSHSM